MLAMVNLQNPVVWAVIVGWILTVVLHELAHGVVAHLGGDYTVRERGGLTLNPLQYVDPMMSIALPIFFLLTGGIPLPGGATYIRDDLLRSRGWASAVSLAGPATNFLLFLLFALPFHPRWGWMHVSVDLDEWSSLQLFLATMVVLQFVVMVMNLIPIPPLDGFGAIKPYLDPEAREKFSSRTVSMVGMLVLFFVVLRVPGVIQGIYHLEDKVLEWLGFGRVRYLIGMAFNKVLFNE